MKRVILIFAAMGTFTAGAQTALGPPSPALSPPTPVFSPGALALPVAPLNPAPNPPPVDTNLSTANLAEQLTNLQIQIEQVLPVLAAFNDSFDFISVPGSTNGSATPNPHVNSGSNLGVNFGVNLATNLATNLAVPTSGFSPVDTSASGNPFGLPPGFVAFPVTRDMLRAMLSLENDLQRMLPVLNALNGGTNNFIGVGLTPGFVPGQFNRVFGQGP